MFVGGNAPQRVQVSATATESHLTLIYQAVHRSLEHSCMKVSRTGIALRDTDRDLSLTVCLSKFISEAEMDLVWEKMPAAAAIRFLVIGRSFRSIL